MQLVIPMSGQGSRFAAAGYQTLKPLIQVHGKPIIAHVLEMFPNATDIVFICNEEHLAHVPELRTTLHDIAPHATIVAIAPHKRGPVHAVAQAYDHIADDEPIMVSYCDYAQRWDSEGFLDDVARHDAAGAVPSYTGFHPHLLRNNRYAGVRVDEASRMLEIREKHCFTPDPQDSHHSSGAYFFRTGAMLKHYFNNLMARGETINGEYYVSMVYPLMLADNLTVTVPEVTYFMQWGTPEDLEEYEAWLRRIYSDRSLAKPLSDIPQERESLIRVPFSEDSPLFSAVYEYWKRVYNL